MNVSHKYFATASALVFASLISFGSAEAQNKMKPGMQEPTANEENCEVEGNCAPGSGQVKKNRVDQDDATEKPRNKERRATQDQNDNDVGENDNDGKSARQASNKGWRYDSDKHQRRRNKDARYKYYYSGYWYAEPYWTVEVYGSPNRISCGEGREIIDDRGFSRVRVIECSGRNFTYAARRHGDTFRVVLNSRSGNIVSVRPL